jgi:nucleoside-diphosphate-sugar epimerase
MEDQERNSVDATRKLMQATAAAGVKRFIHISSLAVLKSCRNSVGPLDESSPVDSDNPGRGAYVWGKAKAEAAVVEMARHNGIEAKIIRPGPLVDFSHFEAPGRLGREVGSYFIVMGGRESCISLCDVQTAARVVRYYLAEYDSAPRVLNLIEPKALTRRELVSKLLEARKDLKAVYVPGAVVRSISAVLCVLQKAVNPSRKPLSIAQAFSSESYDTGLAVRVIAKTTTN